MLSPREKVLARCVPEPHPDFDLPCQIWQGSQTRGYGTLRYKGRVRYAMHLITGPIMPGWDRDHLCRRTLCCERSHIDIVTHETNVLRGRSLPAQNARKTHCPKGHPLSGANLYEQRYEDGRVYRSCRTCRAEHNRARYPARLDS